MRIIRSLLVGFVALLLVASVFGTVTGTGVSVEDESLSGGSVAEEDAVDIEDWHDLYAVRDDLEGDYVLMNDLDEDTDGYEELVDTEDGWEPIDDFLGTFDGQANEIENLKINRSDEDRVGLFGSLYGTIKNIALVDADVSGDEDVGALVGRNSMVVRNSYVTGDVSGDGEVGGLVGRNWGTVENSYATGDVSGEDRVGGLVGWNRGLVSDTYATGIVSGDRRVGGLVGYNRGGSVEDSFWDIETTGQDESDGGMGKTTEEMKDMSTFTDTSTEGLDDPWHFVGNPNDDESNRNIWDIDEDEVINEGYPFLTEEVDEGPYLLRIKGAGTGGTVEVECDDEKHEVEDYRWTQVYEEGTNISLEAVPVGEYSFGRWRGDIPDGEEGEKITITITEDMEIRVQFESNTPGFTSTLLLVTSIITVAIYQKKKQ